ncbi:MAG TPA: hypothetical protein PKM25_06930, partial [Candidatus Ozemobacteraceae bacterium]|nr:hypothetical protein [Candidatus Ozemobacteraceae bacterium]
MPLVICPDADTVSFRSTASEGVLLGSNGTMWCRVPSRFSHKILQFVTIRNRKDDEDSAGATATPGKPAWMSIRARVRGTDRWITWSDQFGSLKAVPPASLNQLNWSSFLGYNEQLGSRGIDGVLVVNQSDGRSPAAPIRIHEINLVFLHTGSRGTTDRVFDLSRARRVNGLTWRYQLDSVRGLPLAPGHSFEFELPEKSFPWIGSLALKHRKDPALLRGGRSSMDGWDQDPAYVRVEIRDAETGLWTRWADRWGSDKFAEARPADNPEDETLHSGLRTFGRIRADRARITNVSKGDPVRSEVRIHELQVSFYPDRSGAGSFERIFTPETVFPDPENGVLVALQGGGERLEGRYPGAIPLGPGYRSRVAAIAALPAGHSFPMTIDPPAPCRRDGLGRLIIPLPERGRLLLGELAIGDLDVTALTKNKDGGFGRTGRAELSVRLRNRSVPGRDFPALIRYNIGPAGLITFGVPQGAGPLQPGDELVISVDFDVAFLMGYRVSCTAD